MNCYEFNAVEGMSISIEVEGWIYNPETGNFDTINGVQTHLSVRPTSRPCLICAGSYPFHGDQTPSLPIRLCDEQEVRDLALRRDANCNRFQLRKAPDANLSTIAVSGREDDPSYFEWPFPYNPGNTGFRQPPIVKPWDPEDPFYARSLVRYNAIVANTPPGAALGKLYGFIDPHPCAIFFHEFENGSTGELFATDGTLTNLFGGVAYLALSWT